MSKFAPLWLAVHASAHAVTQLVMSETYFPGPRIRSVTVKANGKVMGHVHTAPRVCPLQPDTLVTL
jgi:hypothetical protein